MKRTLMEVAVLVLIATALAGISNLVRPESGRLAWIGRYAIAPVLPMEKQVGPSTEAKDPAAAIAPPKDPGALYLAIIGEVAERLHQAGALFIDARRSEAFAEGHIPGARSIPVWEKDADARVAELAREKVPYDRVIVIYCSGANCTDSEMLAPKLAASGFFNLYIYRAGFPGWTQRGGEVRKGETP